MQSVGMKVAAINMPNRQSSAKDHDSRLFPHPASYFPIPTYRQKLRRHSHNLLTCKDSARRAKRKARSQVSLPSPPASYRPRSAKDACTHASKRPNAAWARPRPKGAWRRTKGKQPLFLEKAIWQAGKANYQINKAKRFIGKASRQGCKAYSLSQKPGGRSPARHSNMSLRQAYAKVRERGAKYAS